MTNSWVGIWVREPGSSLCSLSSRRSHQGTFSPIDKTPQRLLAPLNRGRTPLFGTARPGGRAEGDSSLGLCRTPSIGDDACALVVLSFLGGQLEGLKA